MAFTTVIALLLATSSIVVSQNSSFPSSTAVANASQTSSAPASFVTNVELSVEGTSIQSVEQFLKSLSYRTRLNYPDLWNLYVGPVSTFSINTTVEPTPIPSSSLIPPPSLYYPPFPTGQQVPLQSKNESWSFPKTFWYGVAGASYQIEGAVKAEGRGPSIWDVLSHRVPGYVITNETGDNADNNYYMYKEGAHKSHPKHFGNKQSSIFTQKTNTPL